MHLDTHSDIEGAAGVEKHTPEASTKAATRSSQESLPKSAIGKVLSSKFARRKSDQAQCD